MAVKKYTLNEENYLTGKAFLEEIKAMPTINQKQLFRLHELSTILGYPSQPGGCASCNRRAKNQIMGYVNEYERIIINGEEA